MNFISKVVRKLIEMDVLGNRFINFLDCGISYDKKDKRLFQLVYDKKVYIARCSHGIAKIKGIDMVEWLNSQVYFSHYSPKNKDVYVDIGSGYGHELIYIAKNNPDVSIFGIEANPEVFQYARANISPFNNIKIYNLMIGVEKSYQISFTTDYAGKGANDSGSIICLGTTLDNFLSAENIDKVSLLKLNVEGGELEILKKLPHAKIEKLIISCHDFRYERGEGDFYRTYDSVTSDLSRYGYRLLDVLPEVIPSTAWEKSLKYWVFATKL